MDTNFIGPSNFWYEWESRIAIISQCMDKLGPLAKWLWASPLFLSFEGDAKGGFIPCGTPVHTRCGRILDICDLIAKCFEHVHTAVAELSELQDYADRSCFPENEDAIWLTVYPWGDDLRMYDPCVSMDGEMYGVMEVRNKQGFGGFLFTTLPELVCYMDNSPELTVDVPPELMTRQTYGPEQPDADGGLGRLEWLATTDACLRIVGSVEGYLILESVKVTYKDYPNCDVRQFLTGKERGYGRIDHTGRDRDMTKPVGYDALQTVHAQGEATLLLKALHRSEECVADVSFDLPDFVFGPSPDPMDDPHFAETVTEMEAEAERERHEPEPVHEYHLGPDELGYDDDGFPRFS